METIMLKFLKRYKSDIVRITISNTLQDCMDYYFVECVFNIEDPQYSESNGNVFEYTRTCRVNIDEFNKFKSIEEAVIWD